MNCVQKTRRKPKDRVGIVYGHLVGIRPVDIRHNEYRWLFECRNCGGAVVTYAHAAKENGHCGCLTFERLSRRSKTHGRSLEPIYKMWSAMRERCNNPKHKYYSYYGGRGIRVCEAWDKSFETFVSDMGERPHRATIDRIDNSGNYEPTNCRWASRKEQQNNRRVNVRITIGHETKTMTEWCEVYGIAFSTVKGRIRRGWLPADAVMCPVGTRKSWLIHVD